MTTEAPASTEFPACLLADPTVFSASTTPDRARSLNAWVQRHNSTVLDYAQGGRLNGRLTRNERAILALADGLRSYVASSDHASTDDHDQLLTRDVLTPLVGAFIAALNWDLGKLDAGTLDAWARRLFSDFTGESSDVL